MLPNIEIVPIPLKRL